MMSLMSLNTRLYKPEQSLLVHSGKGRFVMTDGCAHEVNSGPLSTSHHSVGFICMRSVIVQGFIVLCFNKEIEVTCHTRVSMWV